MSTSSINRRRFLRGSTGLAASVALGGLSARGLAQNAPGSPPANHRNGRKPNILLITADDLGIQLSCYGLQQIRTPHLDALAAGGTRFSNAYITQPSCSPSRSSIFTGLYPHQNGHLGLSHRGFRMHAGLAQKAFPALLKAAGYRSGVLGKIHVDRDDAFDFDWRPDYKKLLEGGAGSRNVQAMAEAGGKWMREGGDDPFLLMMNYLDPHDPLLPQFNGLPREPVQAADVQPLPWAGGKRDAELNKRTANFFNCVKRLDDGIGLLMAELEKSGRAENTVVIFLGDHGAPFTRGKLECYESGLQVPFLVRMPGAPRNQVRSEFISSVDIVPTLLDIAGVPNGAMAAGVTGRSFAPLVRGENLNNWRPQIFGEMNFHGPNHLRPMRSVREGRWKLIHNLEPTERPAWQLFDLQSDPYERTNLAGQPQHAVTLKRLQDALLSWRQQTNDPILDPKVLARWQAAHEKWKEKNVIPPEDQIS